MFVCLCVCVCKCVCVRVLDLTASQIVIKSYQAKLIRCNDGNDTCVCVCECTCMGTFVR